MTKFGRTAGTSVSTFLVVSFATVIGTAGYRCHSGSSFTVQVETTSLDTFEYVASALSGDGWQADSQSLSFTREVTGTYDDLKQVLARVTSVLYVGGEITVNDEAPHWVRTLVSDTVEDTLSLYGRLCQYITGHAPAMLMRTA
jgi:hypothetical protein